MVNYDLAILVTGSRQFKDQAFVEEVLTVYDLPWESSVVLYEGGQQSREYNPKIPALEVFGLDYLAKQVAIKNKWEVKSFPANWKLLGKRAGMVRNEEMVDAFIQESALRKVVVGFPLEGSVGTYGCMNYALEKELDVNEVNYPDIQPRKISLPILQF